MNAKTVSDLTNTLRDVLVSPNVADANGEAANLVDVLDDLTWAVWHGMNWRSDPTTRPNAIEGHGEAIKVAAETIALAIGDLASAIRERATDGLSADK
jgi:hypothetical protein